MRRANPFILSTVSFAALASTPAFAQQTQSDQAPPQALTTEQAVESGQPTPNCDVPPGTPLPPQCSPATGGEAITITGTRIRRPNLESPLPVTSVGGEQFFQTGNVSVGDKLAELPSIRSTFTQANSTRFLGTAGLNLLDLRGLGTVRTLVLVNGRRHVGGDVLSSGVTPDVNTIPTDLIERVDVVTGGNSAVYGSDAIAGVVNFVLKQNYDGIQLRGQGGVSTYKDAGSYFVSGLIGKNFADGRGNVAVNLEYARREQAWGDERGWFHRAVATVDSDPASAPSDGIPDRILNPNFFSATFSNTGTVRIGGQSNTGATVPFNCGLDPLGRGYNCPFIFLPNGTLVPETGTRVGIGPSGQFIGPSNAQADFVNGKQIQITPQLDRYNVNLIGHFEVTPAIVPFIEAKFSRTDSSGTGASGPFFISGQTLGDILQFFFAPGSSFATDPGNREAIALNNPYLDPAARTTITNAILASGVNNCNFRPLTATDLNRIAAGTFRFCEQLNWTGLSPRTEKARRDTYRIVGGFRGDLGGNWNYELSLNKGHLKERTKILGNVDVQRMLLALDAVRDPNTGQIVCASQIDPSRAFGYGPWYYGTDPNANAKLAADIAACVPINPMGGQVTEAQKNYVLLNTVARGSTSQFDALGFISGDTSKWFELPGGPIGIVLGAEYRTDDLFYQQDPLVEFGYTFYNAIPTFAPPKSKVKEAFGEIRLPILKDLPFVHELEISGAARVSDYNLGTTGTVWAYNGNAIYSPIRGLRLRGNYARSVRAPNQGELFAPFGQNFSLITDPCDVNQVGAGSATRAANCLADGVPAGSNIQYSSSLPFLSGGNVDLAAERSNSLTLGGVVTPAFLPGFSLSVDYYNIKVKSVITSPTAQGIINACYDSPDINNQFCALFDRAGASGAGANNNVPFGILINSLHQQPLNYAKLTARGVDTEIAYRHNVAGLGRIDTRFTWTHQFERTNFLDPQHPDFGNRVLSELGDPKDAFNWNASLQHGRYTFGYQMRYISHMIVQAGAIGQYEDFFPFQGRAPQNADAFERKWYPAAWYHDVRLGIDVGPKFNFYMGVDNLTNKKPPYNATGIGGNSGIYDAIGRFMYAGAVAKF